MAQCKGKTTEGKRCKITARDNGYCGRHQDQAAEQAAVEADADSASQEELEAAEAVLDKAVAEDASSASGDSSQEGTAPTSAAAPPPTSIKTPEKEVRLYPIVESIAVVEEMIEEAGGEITPETEKMLDRLWEDFEAGAEKLLQRMTELKAGGEVARQEARRITEIARSREKLYAAFKSQIHGALRSRRMKRLEVGTFKVTVASSPPAVEIEDGADVTPWLNFEYPPQAEGQTDLEYWHKLALNLVEQVSRPDKTKILEYFNQWQEYFETVFEDESQYQAHLVDPQFNPEGDPMTKEELARQCANAKLPEGISVRHSTHVRGC